MPNIIDYVNWRGDLTFKQVGFTEVDNLILSMFSYLSIEHIMWGDKKITINEAYRRAMSVGIPENTFFHEQNKELFNALANSERFGNLFMAYPTNKIDEKEQQQFYAVTILLPDNTIYVSYRGTDNTLVGWKEDFNMVFSSEIPSQRDAVQYLEKIAKTTKKKIRVGGHSKGGNLAIYAAAFCSDNVKKRIIEVYNNDGPGMSSEIIDKNEYREIIGKIHTYIPQSSVIGRLLYHEGKYTVVQSTQKGLMQHDAYSWQIKRTKFVCLDEVTDGSVMIDKVLKEWLIEVDAEHREEFIETLYQVLCATEARTINEITNNWFKSARIILKAYTSSDETSKKIVSQALSAMLNIARENWFESLSGNSKKKDDEE